MASRMITLVRPRLAAVLGSVAAAIASLSLYFQWASHEAQQRAVLASYPRLREHFSQAELDRMMPASSDLVVAALGAGVLIAVAFALWTRKAT